MDTTLICATKNLKYYNMISRGIDKWSERLQYFEKVTT